MGQGILPIVGGSNNGVYVWEKRMLTLNISDSISDIMDISDQIDGEKVNIYEKIELDASNEIVGTGNSTEFNLIYMGEIPVTQKEYPYLIENNNAYTEVTTNKRGTFLVGKLVTFQKSETPTYVTSDNPTEYPDNGVVDKYLYIKVNRATIDGVTPTKEMKLISKCVDLNLSPLPYNFYQGSAVVCNNEIHILGGRGAYTKHYKYNGSSWTSVSTLPYEFSDGSAVVYNNEIHILGGSRGVGTEHYKYNGSSWTSVSTLPYRFYQGSAVVYNNEIHILGGIEDKTKHYRWSGASWVNVSILLYGFSDGSAVVYNNEIHILGDDNSGSNEHYKWDGTSWVNVSTLPYTFYYGSVVVYNNEIHILGGSDGSGKEHYKWDGTSWTWTQVSTLPYAFYQGSAVVYDNEINILGGTNNYTKHFIIQLKFFKEISQ